jgi:hypothetical protein
MASSQITLPVAREVCTSRAHIGDRPYPERCDDQGPVSYISFARGPRCGAHTRFGERADIVIIQSADASSLREVAANRVGRHGDVLLAPQLREIARRRAKCVSLTCNSPNRDHAARFT